MYLERSFGLGTAIITPFDSKSAINYTALKNHVRFQIQNNVDYIVALGTTSESVTLSKEERAKVVDVVLEGTQGKVPVIVGVGGYNTQEIIKTISQLPKEVYGVLSVTPYYNKPSQEGLYQHYRQIALSTDKPIILYNVPGRTSVNMLPQTTLRLANEFKNIVAVKEASGVMTQIMEIIRQKPQGFQVLSGDDSIAYPLLASGSDGLISVIANAFPKQMSEMVHAAIDGKFSEARTIHYKLLPLMLAIFEDGNPAGIKKLMNTLNLVDNNLRLPLVPVNNANAEKIEQLAGLLSW